MRTTSHAAQHGRVEPARLTLATAYRDRIVREALRRALKCGPFEVLWHAADADELERRMKSETPRLLLAEVDLLGAQAERMPGLLSSGAAVIALAPANAVGAAYEALGRGALGLVEPPGLADDGELIGAEKMLARVERLASLLAPARSAERSRVAPKRGAGVPLVAIGASTGGPLALATVLKGFPAGFPGAILIVQHIESEYSAGLAAWLGSFCALPVTLAERGEQPCAGHVHVAGPNGHLVLQNSLQFGNLIPMPNDLHVPSIDVLFKSLADHAPPGAAAILTGMGHDGVEGLARLRRKGWATFAQDEASSVVYGMPRAALESGAAEQSLPLSAIGPALLRHVARRGSV